MSTDGLGSPLSGRMTGVAPPQVSFAGGLALHGSPLMRSTYWFDGLDAVGGKGTPVKASGATNT